MVIPRSKRFGPGLPAWSLMLAAAGVFVLLACAELKPRISEPEPPAAAIGRVHFAIQVGAFANIENAVRLTESLQRKGLNAYHFIDSGLYKVRFGNYATDEIARQTAARLQSRGVIEVYYIVRPQPAATEPRLREQLVHTASGFIGVPYKWGGESPAEGFDCSGLTMTVYQLNGLDLPRTSRQQWRLGTPIQAHVLNKGDLVFFATSGGRRVSHVGIYAGDGRFIHAPGRGKTIRYASIDSGYFRRRYLGARSYIDRQ